MKSAILFTAFLVGAQVKAEQWRHRMDVTGQWDPQGERAQMDDRYLKDGDLNGHHSKETVDGGKGKKKEKGGKGGEKSMKKGMSKHRSEKKMKEKGKQDSRKRDDYVSNDKGVVDKSGKNSIGMMKEHKSQESMKKLGKSSGGEGNKSHCGSSKSKEKGKAARNLKIGVDECDEESQRGTDEPTPAMIFDTPAPSPSS
jgi:hypothetical protein